jgi:hypothetical protein
MDESPRKWWQWALMYPTLLIALVAAVPQLYQWGRGVAGGLPLSSLFGDINKALQQNEAYARNIACLRGSEIENLKLKTKTNYSVELTPCPSGDILLVLTSLENLDLQVSQWIVTRDLFSQVSFFSTTAIAQGSGAQSGSRILILDIKKEGAVVTKRIQLSNNTCVDEAVDAFTGRLMSRRQAPCVKF